MNHDTYLCTCVHAFVSKHSKHSKHRKHSKHSKHNKQSKHDKHSKHTAAQLSTPQQTNKKATRGGPRTPFS